MICSLRGLLREVSASHAVIECGGVGYYVSISVHTYSKIQDQKEVFLHIQSVYREDAAQLFGFYDKNEMDLFNLLISVSGVGLVSALILLSTFSQEEIISAVSSGNYAVLQKAKGIGLKTAQRIIVDLKDKISSVETSGENIATFVSHPVRSEAVTALGVLGIPAKVSEKWAAKYLQENPELDVESLIKLILKSV